MADEQAERFVEIGIIGRPHGVRGEVRVHLHNPSSDIIHKLEQAFLLPPGGDGQVPAARRIEGVRPGPRLALLSFEGVTNRERAAALKGSRMLVPRSLLPPPEEGEFYVDDLIGLEVRAGGARLGTVSASREQGGAEVVTVAVDPPAGGDHEEIQIPLVENFVERLSIAEGVLSVRDIDDLPRGPRRRARG